MKIAGANAGLALLITLALCLIGATSFASFFSTFITTFLALYVALAAVLAVYWAAKVLRSR